MQITIAVKCSKCCGGDNRKQGTLDYQRVEFNVILGNQEAFLKKLLSKLRANYFFSSYET